MPHPFSAAIAADPRFRLRLEGRVLNIVGIASLAIALMVFLTVSFNPSVCVIGGMVVGAGFFLAGNLLCRTRFGADGSFAATTSESVGYAAYAIWLFVANYALTRFSLSTAVPYMLGEAGLLMGLALVLKDRGLERVAVVASAAALALFGAHWQEWNYVTVGGVVASCYAVSLTYGRRGGRAGWYLERASGAAGYATLMFGTYLLGTAPFNTAAMAAEALALIVFGFATDKVGHRFSGVVGIFLACGKLWILDLSGAGAGVRTSVGFVVFGVCSVTAGIFYLVEYVWKSKPRS